MWWKKNLMKIADTSFKNIPRLGKACIFPFYFLHSLDMFFKLWIIIYCHYSKVNSVTFPYCFTSSFDPHLFMLIPWYQKMTIIIIHFHVITFKPILHFFPLFPNFSKAFKDYLDDKQMVWYHLQNCKYLHQTVYKINKSYKFKQKWS